jgi:hypothetical protein
MSMDIFDFTTTRETLSRALSILKFIDHVVDNHLIIDVALETYLVLLFSFIFYL